MTCSRKYATTDGVESETFTAISRYIAQIVITDYVWLLVLLNLSEVLCANNPLYHVKALFTMATYAR